MTYFVRSTMLEIEVVLVADEFHQLRVLENAAAATVMFDIRVLMSSTDIT
jgi:hypothetical protein